MKGTVKLSEIKNLPTIPEYEGIQKQYLEWNLDDDRVDPEDTVGSDKSIDFVKMKENLMWRTEATPPGSRKEKTYDYQPAANIY